MLGLVLFNVFQDNMDNGIKCTLRKTAEGAKLSDAVKTAEGKRMPSSVTWTGLNGGPMPTSRNSTKPSARSCTWIGAIPSTDTGWGEN